MTTEQQENNFALRFAYFLSTNFIEVQPDKYYPFDPKGRQPYDVPPLTAAGCLDEFRKQDIPMLPALPAETDEKTQSLTAEYARVNMVLIKGYTSMMALLYQDGPVEKQHLMEIIRDTMVQANQ